MTWDGGTHDVSLMSSQNPYPNAFFVEFVCGPIIAVVVYITEKPSARQVISGKAGVKSALSTANKMNSGFLVPAKEGR
jgi:hypothetical protein